MAEPLEQMIRRAAETLAAIHAARNETILKSKEVEVIREAEHTAGWSGLSRDDFRRQIVNYAQANLPRLAENRRRHELEATLARVLNS
jgi:hypothetical protein